MPLYEYECQACAHRFELIQRYSDPPAHACPACGGTVKKLLSSPAIQFKGSGWYITDYARKGAETTSKEAPGASAQKTGDSKPPASDASSSASTTSATTAPAPGGSSGTGST